MRYALGGDEQFLEQAMQSINESVRLAPDLGPVQVALGRLHATQGNFDLATAALNRALAIDPNDALANQAIAGVYTRLGRTEDAEASYKKAIALDPDNPTIHDSYANFLAEQSRTEEAVAVWQTVIRLAPDNYAALVNMGSMLTELGRLPEAITVTQRANEIRPSYMAYSNLGTAYARSVRYEDAIQAYQKALEIDDSDWLAWGNMAYVYSWIDGMEEEAERTFEKAIELAEAAKAQGSRDPYIFSDLSLYYAKTGNAELALQNQKTAVTLAPDTGEILAAAAEASETLGRRDDALKFVRRSLDSGYPMKTLQRNQELADLLQDPGIRSHP
jgi:serine/threonine-protein kinase